MNWLVKKRAYIVFLVLFQLLVFVTPLFIKGFHIHKYEQGHSHTAGNTKSYAKAVQWCPIYKFEFVSSIIQDDILYELFKQTNPIINIELANQIFKISFTSCLLRAPPVS
ncbi:MAG: hypothetical protein Q7U54_06190 [Bacteroidales bacterium]|nr:hypothetical protein [Bacteroidales bacterium]